MITKQKIKITLKVLLNVAFRLLILGLVVCQLLLNKNDPSFYLSTESDKSKILLFGGFIATFLSSMLGVGFYLLAAFLIVIHLLRPLKKFTAILSLTAIMLLAAHFKEQLLIVNGGVIGDIMDKYTPHITIPYITLFSCILTLNLFGLITRKKAKKALKKIISCAFSIMKSIPAFLIKIIKAPFSRKAPEPISEASQRVDEYEDNLHETQDDYPEEYEESENVYQENPEDDEELDEDQDEELDEYSDRKEIQEPELDEFYEESIENEKSDNTEDYVEEECEDSDEAGDYVEEEREDSDEAGDYAEEECEDSDEAEDYAEEVDTTHEPSAPILTQNNQRSCVPPMHFLKEPQEQNSVSLDEQNISAEKLKKALADFRIDCKVIGINVGPVVTLYELQPAAGIKSSTIISLSADVARTMSAVSARISILPGKNVVGIELPNQFRNVVMLREILESTKFRDPNILLPIALGKCIDGSPIVADLSKMPHLLVAGTTGSGKSVAINGMILSLIYRLEPHECKMIMIDPKMLELSIYNDIPHLLSPVVTDPKKAIIALKWVVKEMERRYRLMTKLSVRNIERYNQKAAHLIQQGKPFEYEELAGIDPITGEKLTETKSINLTKLPFIVVIVDEMADLMLVAGKEIETSIQRLAQMARASGIHIVMATQRPSVDIITGVIKANFPTRISFAVTSKIDSRTILGEQGAEQLLGRGDMLYMHSGQQPIRVHGPYVSDAEVEKIVDYLKQSGRPNYDSTVTEEEDDDLSNASTLTGEDFDSLYQQAIDIIRRDKKVSISYIQRKLSIGYNKAAKIVEQMEEEGIITAPNHAGKRNILI